jgi:hypothetical protein
MPFPYISSPGQLSAAQMKLYNQGAGAVQNQYLKPKVNPATQAAPYSPGRYTNMGAYDPATIAYQQSHLNIPKPQTAATNNGNTGAGAGNQNTAAPPPDFSKLNYSFDPLLQTALQGGEMQLTGARARMLEQQKQLLLKFGSREMAQKLLGSDPFVNTVSDDPYAGTSDLAQSRYQEIADRNQADIANNKLNLFFSSSRAGDLATVARERLLRESALQNQLQSDLGGLSDNYTTIEQAVRAQKALLNWQAGAPSGGSAAPQGAPPPTAPADDYTYRPPTTIAGAPYTPAGTLNDPNAALNQARLRRLQELGY